ncbi:MULTISPECIES: alpha/beta hydrolase [unclassified Pseudomonas]|uniref:alpha/beta hydrolase n=1 Tax=unclassified Pseudomonas TaxID=196821 RepID=UPI000A1F7BA8|nr:MULTISPECIES: alpha/beta hydrolase [unclassified Pseudomonas]
MAEQGAAVTEGLPKREAADHALTDPKDTSVKTVAITVKKIFIFFVGGAGDQERYYVSGPNWNVNYVRDSVLRDAEILGYVNRCPVLPLAYNKFLTDEDLAKNILSHIPDISTAVYIVGHSLGGWNGAHLSSVLTDKGYKIRMLITLDPVGEGKIVYGISKIYRQIPKPKAEYWINIRAKKIKDRNFSDRVADFGEQWEVTSGPDVNGTVDVNHAFANEMFGKQLEGGKSARQILAESILSYFREK